MSLRKMIKKALCFHIWKTIKTNEHGYDIELTQKCYKCGSERVIYDYFNSQISLIEILKARGAVGENRTNSL